MQKKTINEIANEVDASALKDRPISNWRPILAQECQVYVFGENYIAKRFDQINYKFCEKNEAKEILIDNLYALLRYKYFPVSSEDIDDKISRIVSNFTQNLKTTLIKVSLDKDSDSVHVNYLPDYCCAFRNGVYNFKDNEWLFKYNITYIELLQNTIYQYDPKWIITWYINLNFEPFPININEVSLEEFVEMMKELTKVEKNNCFELLYNMSHDIEDNFSYEKFMHLCEVLGYTLQISFNQNFVIFVGNGGNGKNSLFDGCIINRIVPSPASNSIESFENDRFITGALENKAQNIFLETSQNIINFDSENLKNITGSMYQTIESKGIQKYSSIINCKNIWSANDQEKLKFSDTTHGFRRRINVCEIFYTWDSQKRFLKRGDYYDTTFSDDYREIKNNINNVIVFIYFAMYGLKNATKNFKENFKFTYNDWKYTYSTIDLNLKEKIELFTIDKIIEYLNNNKNDEFKPFFYTISKKRLYEDNYLSSMGVNSFQKMISYFTKDEEEMHSFFSENDAYMNVRLFQKLIGDLGSATKFTQKIKHIYNVKTLNLYNNQPYIKVRFIHNKINIIN